jgi:hypothetical protein
MPYININPKVIYYKLAQKLMERTQQVFNFTFHLSILDNDVHSTVVLVHANQFLGSIVLKLTFYVSSRVGAGSYVRVVSDISVR